MRFYFRKFSLDIVVNRLEGLELLGRRYTKNQLITQCDKVSNRFGACSVMSEQEHLN